VKSIRSMSPLALLFAASALSAPALAAPATGPSRYLTGSDLFNMEWASDPEISPDGRTIAYVRQSNDVMTDKARPTIWLIDVATGQQRPLVARWRPPRLCRRRGR
jgi:dipeptidyl aminopeptidase/acylaminoacyl peptidase